MRFELHAAPIPPLTMDSVDRPGFLLELMEELSNRLSVEETGVQVEVVYPLKPWSRVLMMLGKETNTLLTPVARTPEREDIFVWITPVMRLSYAFATTSDPIDSFEEAMKVPSVAVYRNSQHESLLLEKGFTNLDPHEGSINARLLAFGRVSAWYSTIPEAQWQWKIQKLTPKLVLGKDIFSLIVWVAGSKDFPRERIPIIRRIMREIQADGTYNQIYQDYFGFDAIPIEVPFEY